MCHAIVGQSEAEVMFTARVGLDYELMIAVRFEVRTLLISLSRILQDKKQVAHFMAYCKIVHDADEEQPGQLKLLKSLNKQIFRHGNWLCIWCHY